MRLRKILFCASTASHIRNFHLPYLQLLKEQGNDIWVAANLNMNDDIPFIDNIVNMPFEKKLFSIKNFSLIFSVYYLLKRERFDLIILHTTLASIVVRLAVLLRFFDKKRPKVCYTCHGYLFNEKDKFKWAFLVPEKLCAQVTDVLMVMNREDHKIAIKHHLYLKKLHYINGMGFDTSKFFQFSAEKQTMKRQEMMFNNEDFLLIYAAEFSKRKNHFFLINLFAQISAEIAHAHLLLAGNGSLMEECKSLANELGLQDRVHFLGYTRDMENLYPICDMAITTSLSEGLPFNVMEAMACGLPIVASRIKGHTDLVDDGETGYLCEINNQNEFQSAIIKIHKNRSLRVEMGVAGIEKVKFHSIDKIKPTILAIYNEE
ncbi:glycosyltransferase family 4 protein [Paenibacillus hemerocallicola]|uniref:Glycosyltransferase family 4 protein n=1 Tax=Paenibacillus hemerocallicola TaxID=1172614 RepID=A0A5C4SX28_9BACL|nr:glycosyltransferase family 4 protein [Paenibacillus hemerocallicola]TNJ59756.1 glycosyltransferase family 4 protein [Paenibacillus hemerocallicola]